MYNLKTELEMEHELEKLNGIELGVWFVNKPMLEFLKENSQKRLI